MLPQTHHRALNNRSRDRPAVSGCLGNRFPGKPEGVRGRSAVPQRRRRRLRGDGRRWSEPRRPGVRMAPKSVSERQRNGCPTSAETGVRTAPKIRNGNPLAALRLTFRRPRRAEMHRHGPRQPRRAPHAPRVAVVAGSSEGKLAPLWLGTWHNVAGPGIGEHRFNPGP